MTKSLNELTTTCTAARSWTEFAEQMTAGYVPTLRPHSLIGLRGKARQAQIEWNADVVELANRIETLGWKVWRGIDG